MAEISEECRKHLREIDKRLQMIASAASHQSRAHELAHAAVLRVRRVAESALGDLDEDCREILRGLDPKLDAISVAIVKFESHSRIAKLVAEARSSIGRGGMSGGAGVVRLG